MSLLDIVITVVISLVAAFAAGWFFYGRAATDLRAEAERLRTETAKSRAETVQIRRLINVLAQALQGTYDAGGKPLIDVNFDEKGELVGLVIRGAGHTTQPAQIATGHGAVTPAPSSRPE